MSRDTTVPSYRTPQTVLTNLFGVLLELFRFFSLTNE